MRDVTPQNVEENKKRDQLERLKERRNAKRQNKISSFSTWFDSQNEAFWGIVIGVAIVLFLNFDRIMGWF